MYFNVVKTSYLTKKIIKLKDFLAHELFDIYNMLFISLRDIALAIQYNNLLYIIFG